MTYRPILKNKKAVYISLASAVCAMLLIVLSGIFDRFGGLYQITAIVLGVISIELYMKYIGSDYVYEATDDCFKIYKITGKKSICVSSLDYEMSLSEVVSNKVFDSSNNNCRKYNFNVNFCKNISPSEYYIYFFEFNEKKCMMKFEPDDVFADYLNQKIRDAVADREALNEEV